MAALRNIRKTIPLDQESSMKEARTCVVGVARRNIVNSGEDEA